MNKQITKIYSVFCEEDFETIPIDGSAIVLWYEDLYVYHDGYWKMVEYSQFPDITIIDLTKPVPFSDDIGYTPIKVK